VIWADDTRAPVIQKFADAYSKANGIKVAVQQVDFGSIENDLVQQAPAGEGPDIVIGANDWLGELVKDGVVDPIQLSDANQYMPVATSAFTYNGKLYGLPYSVENIALVTNTQLVPTPPKTWADLETTALQLKKDGKVKIPLALQEGANADPYHDYPLYSALGGYVFGKDANGQLDPSKLGIDSPGALKAADAFGKWAKEGLISLDVTPDIATQDFADGQAPFAITGPWNIAAFDKGAVKGHYTVTPIPPVDGGTPHVFVGVQGFMVSHFAKNKTLANTFLLDYMNTKDAMQQMFVAGGRPSAFMPAYQEEQSDPILQGFAAAGQNGDPLPAIPAMASVWDAWGKAYVLILSGNGNPEQAFKDAANQIRQTIASKG
jgi:maltose-binding protein MalE